MARPRQSHASPFGRRFDGKSEPTPHGDLQNIRYRVEKLTEDRWAHIASAPTVDAALRLLSDKGWVARVVRIRDGVVVQEVRNG